MMDPEITERISNFAFSTWKPHAKTTCAPPNHPLIRLLVEECCGFYIDLEAGERQLYRALRAGLPPATQSNHIQCKSPRFDSSTQYHRFESGLRFSTWLTVLCTISCHIEKKKKIIGDFELKRTRFGILWIVCFLPCIAALRKASCYSMQSCLLFCRRVLYISTQLFTLCNETTRAYRTKKCEYYTAHCDLEEKSPHCLGVLHNTRILKRQNSNKKWRIVCSVRFSQM